MLTKIYRTEAAYFLYGLNSEILIEMDVKEWAYSVIEACDNPPIEIIEVAMSKGRQQLYDNLRSASIGADIEISGRWLLGKLNDEIKDDSSNIKLIVIKAMRIASETNQQEDLYNRLDGLDDDIFLAEYNNYGTLDICRSALKDILAQYNETIKNET